MQKLSVERKNKASDAPVPSAIQYGPVNVGQGPKIQAPTMGHSSSTLMPGYVDPNAYFIPNGYQSTAFYFGGSDGVAGESDGYAGYFNTEGVEMPYGVYGGMYRHGYGYAPYSAYPWSASPAPAVGQDSIFYGSQHYPYPSPYFQSQTFLSPPYSSNHCPTSQGEEAPPAVADQPSVTVGSDRSNSKAFCNEIANWNGGHSPKKHSQQTSSFPSNDSYVRGVLSSGQPYSCYQDSSWSFDGMRSPIPE